MTPTLNPLITPVYVLTHWRLLEFAIVAIGMSVLIWKQRGFSFWPKLLWWYSAIMCYIPLGFPFPLYGQFSRAYESSAGQSLAAVLCVPWLVLNTKLSVKWWAYGCLLIELVCVWLGKPGLMNHASFDIALIALCLPFAPGGSSWLLGLITVFWFHASTAGMMVAAYLGIALWRRRRLGYTLATTFSASFLITLALFRPHFLDGFQSRWDAWARYLPSWYGSITSFWIGVGGGSFMWSSLIIDNFKTPYFISMHNDWLQILFEYGVVGFVLAAVVFCQACSATLKRRESKLIYGVVGAGVFALTYHPLHFVASSVLVALIMRDALKTKENPSQPFDREGSSGDPAGTGEIQ